MEHILRLPAGDEHVGADDLGGITVADAQQLRWPDEEPAGRGDDDDYEKESKRLQDTQDKSHGIPPCRERSRNHTRRKGAEAKKDHRPDHFPRSAILVALR